MGLLLLAAVVGLASAPVSGAAPGRTVMAWISTAVSNWDRCAQFLDTGGDGEGMQLPQHSGLDFPHHAVPFFWTTTGCTFTGSQASLTTHTRARVYSPLRHGVSLSLSLSLSLFPPPPSLTGSLAPSLPRSLQARSTPSASTTSTASTGPQSPPIRPRYQHTRGCGRNRAAGSGPTP